MMMIYEEKFYGPHTAQIKPAAVKINIKSFGSKMTLNELNDSEGPEDIIA